MSKDWSCSCHLGLVCPLKRLDSRQLCGLTKGTISVRTLFSAEERRSDIASLSLSYSGGIPQTRTERNTVSGFLNKISVPSLWPRQEHEAQSLIYQSCPPDDPGAPSHTRGPLLLLTRLSEDGSPIWFLKHGHHIYTHLPASELAGRLWL